MEKRNLFKEDIKEKNIVVYGAGVIGKSVVERLIFDDLEQYIKAIVVTEKENNPDSILGIPVLGIKNIVAEISDCIILVAVGKKVQSAVLEYLSVLQLSNVYTMDNIEVKEWLNDLSYKRYAKPYIENSKEIFCHSDMSNEKKENIIINSIKKVKEEKEVNLTRLVVVLGTKCSLRCKECNNLMPYFKPQKDLNIEKILQSLEILNEKVNSILKCELIGGEPFLSKNLKEVISYLLRSEKIHKIEITTNGTIMPEKDLIPSLVNEKVTVLISDYGDLVDKDKLIHYLTLNKIKYAILEGGKWISPGGIEKRGRSKEVLQKYYNNCGSGYICKTLYEDKIFSCARAASLYALGCMKEEEYVSINNNLDINEIKQFWLKDYSEACDYCDIACEERKIIEPAEQI